MKRETESRIKTLSGNDDPSALEIIYDEIGEKLYKYILSILCSEEKAEEVMQNLFVAIAEKRHRLARVRNLTGYIFKMAKNETMNFLRAQSANEAHERNFEDYQNIVALKDDRGDRLTTQDLREVNQALLSLPLAQREVISLKIFQEMTFKSISRALNISLNTVASRYRYGIEKLKSKLRRFKDGV